MDKEEKGFGKSYQHAKTFTNQNINEMDSNSTIPTKKETLARIMYDDYSTAVGGKAFNGDQLPKSDEFFNDETKQKQANAWRLVAETAVNFVINQLK